MEYLQSLLDFNAFHFQQPLALLVMIPLLALVYWLMQSNAKQDVWLKVCDSALLKRYLATGEIKQRRTPALFLAILSLLLSVALAQPVWQKLPQPRYEASSALVIALDLSASMNATDLKPSRLKQAQFKLRDLLKTRADGQTALLVYAGDAFVVTPLTSDISTIESQLDALTPAVMPVQGSHPERAIELAQQLLSQAGIQQGDLLLIGDEINSSMVTKQISEFTQNGGRVSVLATAKENAAVPGLRTRAGEPVIAEYDFAQMRHVAELGGGTALEAKLSNIDVERLARLFNSQSRLQAGLNQQDEADQWVAGGPWFILLALPLMLMMFRRGLLTMMPLVAASLLFYPAEQSYAVEWKDLWQTADQQADLLLKQGKAGEAAELFENDDWKQAAHYRNGDFEQALSAQANPTTSDQWYNRGNSLARLDRFEQAIEAYQRALEQNPDNQDALSNLELVRKALEQQQQQQQQQQQNESEESQQGQSEQKQSQPQQQSGDQGESDSQSDTDPQAGSNESEAEQSNSSDTDKPAPTADRQSSAGNDSEQQSSEQSEQNQQAFSEAMDEAADAEQTPQEGQESSGREAQPIDEASQAREQLLNQVVDDPAGLWRRKFYYQYQQRAQPAPPGDKPW